MESTPNTTAASIHRDLTARCLRDREDRRRLEGYWSWARLLSFTGLVTAWYPLRFSDLAAGAALATGLALFAWCVRRHSRVREDRLSLDRKLALLAESGRRLGGAVTVIRGHQPLDGTSSPAALAPLLDDAARWELTAQELDDLDLYAPSAGLFGLLHRASSAYGARRLAALMEHPLLDPRIIQRRQRAVRWLMEHTSHRLHAMTGCAALRDLDPRLEDLRRAVETSAPLPWGLAIHALRIWSVVSAGLVLYLTYRVGRGEYFVGWYILGLLAFNASLFRPKAAALRAAVTPWREVGQAARGYLCAGRHAVASLPEKEDLGLLRGAFAAVIVPSALPGLCRVVGWSDVGGPAHVLFNHLFFYDLHVAHAILKSAAPHRDALLRGLSALADLEALCSLACFGWEQPVRSFAELADRPRLHIHRGHHPGLPPSLSVSNDVALDERQRMWLITGSNMAGKSTYLRMIGINALLAQIGAPACAEAMTLAPVRLVTDLRVRDNLAAGESYFLAEVRHLRRMVEPPDHPAPLLGLIDEPFRGTNSHEQAAATLAVVEHLRASRHFFVIATHERRVTDLADGRAALNRHFEENLSAAGMIFDYRLREGPARTRNALRVLAQEGYPPEILAAADRWAQHMTAPPADHAASRDDGHA